MQKKDNFKVFRSSAGLGLKTVRSYKKGQNVIEYIGERITSDEADERGGRYLFELNDKRTIDGSSRDNLARYINHSCRPNCEAELNYAETRVFFKALRDIAAGEEITVHYGKTYFDEFIKPYGCLCEHCQKKAKQSASVA